MNNPKKSCATCKIVNKVCFWGEMPQKKWKRPALFILSIVLLVGGSYLYSINEHPSSHEPFTLVLLLLAVSILLFGLLVSVIGCNSCVARIFGNV